jgi:hypothetical protein
VILVRTPPPCLGGDGILIYSDLAGAQTTSLFHEALTLSHQDMHRARNCNVTAQLGNRVQQ